MMLTIAVRRGVRAGVLPLLAAGCCLMTGCDLGHQLLWSVADDTVRSTEARSPDGKWLASARTVQTSGPGSSGVATSVYLARMDGPQHPVEVLEFQHDQSSPQFGSNVAIKWIGPAHLDVTYNGYARVTSQVANYGHVSISLECLSQNAPRLSP